LIDFVSTTAFRLVRRLVMGQRTASMYLLVHEQEAQSAIEADLQAELEVQIGAKLRIADLSELVDKELLITSYQSGAMAAIRIDSTAHEIIGLLDTHVIRLERSGAQLLFLATPALAEPLLVQAPNFRNRITEIMRIVPDEGSGDVTG
jgi:hypothetical protein